MFYGVTRYSLFSPGSLSWKTSRGGVFGSPDDYKDYLFSEQRLQLREELFFARSVPVLAAMAEDYDYTHFVLYSGLLPQRHQEVLFEAAAKHPFLVPVEWNDVVRGTGIEEVQPLMEKDLAGKFVASDGAQPVVWFRLDDDDVLASDYLAHLERYRRHGHLGMAISFGLGLTAYKTDDELVNLREYYHPKSAQGMAFVTAYDPVAGRVEIKAPGPHTGVDRLMPTILDSREHMFFQMRHSDQDSTLNDTPFERTAESLARLDKLPAIKVAGISPGKWPTVYEEIVRGEPVAHALSFPAAQPLRLTEDTELSLPLESQLVGGLVQFEFEFESELEVDGAFAVVSYELSGAEGVDVEELGAKLGLRKSPTYGMYWLAWSREARGVMRHSLPLPEGLKVVGITLRGKKRQPADIFIRWCEPRVVALHAGN